jgi:GAG-pre-integrase domain
MKNMWLMDSGATSHSCPYQNDFITYQNFKKPIPIGTASNEVIYFKGIGNILLSFSQKKRVLLKNVYYCPSRLKQICSTQYLACQGMKVIMTKDNTHVWDSKGVLYLKGSQGTNNILHWFKATPVCLKDTLSVPLLSLYDMEKKKKDDFPTWHSCLGHPSDKVIHKLPGLIPSFLSYPSDWYKPTTCIGCLKGKMVQQPFKASYKRATMPLELIHCNLIEVTMELYYQECYILSIVDDYSGYGHVVLL